MDNEKRIEALNTLNKKREDAWEEYKETERKAMELYRSKCAKIDIEYREMLERTSDTSKE